MANRHADRHREADDKITHGNDNVFADLGYPDAEERQTKLRLTYAINQVVTRRRLSKLSAMNEQDLQPSSKSSGREAEPVGRA